MQAPNTQRIIERIEERYGPYASGKDPQIGEGIRNDAIKFLYSRYKDDRYCLERVFNAVNAECLFRFGPPEIAAIKKAIAIHEKDTGSVIEPKVENSPRMTSAERIAQMEETEIDIKAQAQAAGIDTEEEGWLAEYMLAEIKKRDRR